MWIKRCKKQISGRSCREILFSAACQILEYQYHKNTMFWLILQIIWSESSKNFTSLKECFPSHPVCTAEKDYVISLKLNKVHDLAERVEQGCRQRHGCKSFVQNCTQRCQLTVHKVEDCKRTVDMVWLILFQLCLCTRVL